MVCSTHNSLNGEENRGEDWESGCGERKQHRLTHSNHGLVDNGWTFDRYLRIDVSTIWRYTMGGRGSSKKTNMSCTFFLHLQRRILKRKTRPPTKSLFYDSVRAEDFLFTKHKHVSLFFCLPNGSQ